MDSEGVRESLDGRAISIGAIVGLAVGFVGLAMGGVFAFFGAVAGGATAAWLSDPPFRTRVLNALVADLASSALVYLLVVLVVFLVPAVIAGGIVAAPLFVLLYAGVALVIALPIAIVSAVIAMAAGAGVARFRSGSDPDRDAR